MTSRLGTASREPSEASRTAETRDSREGGPGRRQHPPARDPITTGSTAHNWTALEGPQVLEILSSREQGLTSAEAADRLAEAGPNILPSAPKPGAVIIYAHQFKNPLVYLLLAAAVVSLGVGEIMDALFIFVVLQLNAVIGTFR